MSAQNPDSARLVEECQGLVRTLARQVMHKAPRNVELDDLIAYGQVGLAEAAHDFDPSRGHRFSTFAYYRIRGAIYDGLSKLCGMSRGHYHQVRYQQAAGEVLAESAGRPEPDVASIQDRDLCWVRDLSRNLAVASLITTVGTCEDPQGKADSDDARTSPPALAIDKEIRQILHQLVNALPKQEGDLIRAAYFEGLTLQEAGHRLGISKSWATRLHSRALERLARSLKQLDLVS